jgi:hypothetical protein
MEALHFPRANQYYLLFLSQASKHPSKGQSIRSARSCDAGREAAMGALHR